MRFHAAYHAFLALCVIIAGLILIHYSGSSATVGSIGVQKETIVYCINIAGTEKTPIENSKQCCSIIFESNSCERLQDTIDVYYDSKGSLNIYNPDYVCFKANNRVYFKEEIKKECKLSV